MAHGHSRSILEIGLILQEMKTLLIFHLMVDLCLFTNKMTYIGLKQRE